MGKLVPAAILLVTAYQLLSDRNTLFGGPKPTVWSAPSTDGGGGDSGGGDGSSTAAAMTVSSGPQGAGVPLVLPEGFKPVVAEPCRYHSQNTDFARTSSMLPLSSDTTKRHLPAFQTRCWLPCSLEAERPLDWQGHILAVPGGPGSAFNVKHTAQVLSGVTPNITTGRSAKSVCSGCRECGRCKAVLPLLGPPPAGVLGKLPRLAGLPIVVLVRPAGGLHGCRGPPVPLQGVRAAGEGGDPASGPGAPRLAPAHLCCRLHETCAPLTLTLPPGPCMVAELAPCGEQ